MLLIRVAAQPSLNRNRFIVRLLQNGLYSFPEEFQGLRSVGTAPSGQKVKAATDTLGMRIRMAR